MEQKYTKEEILEMINEAPDIDYVGEYIKGKLGVSLFD